jgi:hypothetical protein
MGQIVNDVEEIINNKESQKETKSERKKILAEMQRVNSEKTNLIKKALSAQRAKFGAGGSDSGMSTDAVLKRLTSETAEPYDEKLQDAKYKLSKIKTPRNNLLKTFLEKFDGLL